MADARLDGTRVLIVDDHPVVRHGMASLLHVEDWVAEVFQADTVAQARRLAVLERPDVAVIDLGLPDGDGVALIAELTETVPACAAVVVTMTNDPGSVRAALTAGAKGYLLKDAAPDMLVSAVLAATAGARVLGPHVDVALGGDTAQHRRTRRPRSPLDVLTAREQQLLGLLARGRTTRDTARELSVSEKTVRNQVAIIIGKLGVADRVQAALLAQRHGLQ